MSAKVMEGTISSVKLGTTWKQTWLVGVLEAPSSKYKILARHMQSFIISFKTSLLEIMLARSEFDVRILLRLESNIMKTMSVYQG